MHMISRFRRVAAGVALPVAVMLSGCGVVPSGVGSPQDDALPTQGEPVIGESTTTMAIPVETLPSLPDKPDLPGETYPQPVFDESTTTLAIPVVTLQPPKDPVPLGPGDLASQFIGQVIQMDPNAKQVFVGQIALPPDSFYRGGMVVMGDDARPTVYALDFVEIANRSRVAVLIRPVVGGKSPGPAITPPGVVVAVLEVLLAPGEQLVVWDCLVDGRPDKTVLAVAKDGRGMIPAIRAWRVEPVNEKIVEIDAGSVVCDLSQI